MQPSPTPGVWSEISIAGHPCDVYEPPTRHPLGLVLVYLHGVHLNRLHDKTEFVAQFARHGLPVLCPHTQRSWWTDKICAEFDPRTTAEKHLLHNVLPEIERRWQVRPGKIGLLGTSMGGQGALRFAYKHPKTFPVAAAISPAIDYHLRFLEGDETLPLMYPDMEAARQDTALLHVHPLNYPPKQFFCCDPADERWWDSADRLRMKLYSMGIPHECDLETTGGGHGFAYYNRMAERAITFVVKGLEQEQRRLAMA